MNALMGRVRDLEAELYRRVTAGSEYAALAASPAFRARWSWTLPLAVAIGCSRGVVSVTVASAPAWSWSRRSPIA
jgi:hypothetical protein